VTRTSATPLVGLVVPSSNPTIERFLAEAKILEVLGVDVVVTRMPVTRIGSDGESNGQFTAERLWAAAQLLVDAEVDVVVWAGTAGFWQADERAVLDAVARQTDGPVTSSREAMLAALDDMGASETTVLTPYVKDVHHAVVRTFEDAGFEVPASHGLGLMRNLDFSRVPAKTIAGHILVLAGRANHPVAIVCTNMLGVASGPPVVDSIVATLWHAARRTGGTSASYLASYSALLGVPLASVSIDPRTDAGPALQTLRVFTKAQRATLRLDVPGMNFPCVAESCAEGIEEISDDNSLDQAGAATAQWITRTHRVLVQPNFKDVNPAPPQALQDLYGVRAQMLAPVIVEGERVGWISLHSTVERVWNRGEIMAIEAAANEYAGRIKLLRKGQGFTRWLT
jgi:maleate isomerase